MEVEKRKKLYLLWISVLSISLLVLTVWILKMRNQIVDIKNNDNTEENRELEELKNEFSQFFQTLNKEVKEIKKDNLPEIIPEDINNEKEEGDKNKDNQIDLISTSTDNIEEDLVQKDIDQKKCPPYINCMPMIGESVSCEIPVDCEGITIPVY